jgi:hypothetical protein
MYILFRIISKKRLVTVSKKFNGGNLGRSPDITMSAVINSVEFLWEL